DDIGALMQERAAENGARVLVVVSALSGVTNSLQAICEQRKDAAAVAAAIDALCAKHLAFAADLGLAASVLDKRLYELRALGADPRAATDDLGWCAEVLAQGELLSSTLGVAYLRSQGREV